MLSTLPEDDVAHVVTLAARVANRLARHIPTAPARFAPDRPLVSFTFDDAPHCAATLGARMLADHGVRGTYYIAGGLIGTRTRYWRTADPETIVALHEAGHEIGSHTYAHALLPLLRRGAIVEEARRNEACLREIVPGLSLESFAYPFGYGSPGAKQALKAFHRSGRGIFPGLNRGRGDRLMLRANPLIDGGNDAASIGRLMDDALARCGWLIFYGHDVVENPSPYGCAPALLDAALRAAQARGIACVTVAEGLRRAVAGTGSLPSAAGRASRDLDLGRARLAVP